MRTQGLGSLWRPFIAPAVWAGHFLATYVTTAIFCAKAAPHSMTIGGLRATIALYTVLALVLILAWTLRDWRTRATPRQHRAGDSAQHRFLVDVTLLLGGLSAIATIFVAMPVLFFASCR